MSAKSPIRVGVTLPGRRVARWKRDVLVGLCEDDAVEVALVVLTPPASTRVRGPAGLLLRIYGALDRRVFAVDPDPVEEVDVSDLIDGIATVDRQAAPDSAAEASVEALDVAIALGAEADELLDDTRLGLWSYRHGIGRERRDDLPYLRDVKERRLESHVALVRQGDQIEIAHSTVRTDLVSMQRVRTAALLRARHLAKRCLRDLRLEVEPSPRPGAPVRSAESRDPQLGELVQIGARILGRLVIHRLRNVLWHEQWLFAVRRPEVGPPPLSFTRARLHRPPRGRDWADPFPFRAGGRSWLFFEEAPWRSGRGHISVAELDGAGHLHDLRIALQTSFHLSYPFVFTHEGETYLLPQSRTSAATTLYRARRFPDDWEPAGVLADVPLYDPTLLRHEDEWWLFGTSAEPGESEDDELHLYHAATLEGPWRPHPRNPVVSDVRGARPAGPFIVDGSRLLRPAQDCSGRYGRAVVFKEVLELSRTDYREVEVARLDPEWLPRNLGTHHYAADERWAATDALRRRRRW